MRQLLPRTTDLEKKMANKKKHTSLHVPFLKTYKKFKKS